MSTYIVISGVISLLIYLLMVCIFLLHKKKSELIKLENELNNKYKTYYQGKYDEAVIVLKKRYNDDLIKKEKEYKESISKQNEKHKKIIEQIKCDNDKEKLLLLATIKRRQA